MIIVKKYARDRAVLPSLLALMTWLGSGIATLGAEPPSVHATAPRQLEAIKADKEAASDSQDPEEPSAGPEEAEEAEGRSEPPKANPRIEGIASPGLKVTLDGRKSTGDKLRYRWLQTLGPKAEIDDPTAPIVTFTVPESTGPLGFLLMVGNASGLDLAPVMIPVEGRAKGTVAAPELTADAGDDQVGYFLGRQLTLNGIRSEPRGTLGYRWLQVGGPPVMLKLQDGYTFSFVPQEPGLYRFALVVASGGIISEPDTVEITVLSQLPPAALAGIRIPERLSTEDLARSLLASLPDGAALSQKLCEAFEAVHERTDLYGSYADLFNELSRRIEKLLPQDPAQRSLWLQRLCFPLTQRLVEQLRLEGLDVTQARAQTEPLTEAQKKRLAGELGAMAAGLKKVRRTP